jgi:hypothetical protein
MSRLDRHVAQVRAKLTLGLFLRALGATVAAFCGLLVLGLAVDRLARVGVPRASLWVWIGTGLTLVAAVVYAFVRRPTAHQAAVAIDQKLGLAEKFSTALYARANAGSADPFAAAAVSDAERTADNVSLSRRFPIAFPSTGYWAGLAAVVLALAVWLMPTLDLFGRDAARQAAARKASEQKSARQQIEQALARVAALPPSAKNAPQVQLAEQEAHLALQQPTIDPVQATDTAMKLQEAKQAGMDEVKQGQQFAQAQANQQMFNSLNPSADDKGPVADASRDIAKGDFAKAMDKLQSLPQKFGDMAPADQKAAAQQMAKMAAQLDKLAHDPAAVQHLQQQIQQMGIPPQQAQQIAKTMQQAAQGNPQAQQQLQQMKAQVAQQMNGGKGPTPQQQAAINKAMQQMQAAANTQATAQQMSGAAQAMAQAMAQVAGAKPQQVASGPQPAQQGQAGQPAQGAKPGGTKQGAGQQPMAGGQSPGAQAGQQQANAGGQQKQGTSGQQQPGGKQPGNQQANGQQPGGNQPGQQAGGNQPGQTGGGNQPGGQQPSMAQAQQQMQDALGQMDAVQKDNEQQAAAQNGDGGDGNNPGQGQGQQPGQGGQGGPNQGGQGGGPKNNQKGNGGGFGGVGGVQSKAAASYTVTQVQDPSQRIANGRMLAKTFVKAPQDKGASTIQFTPAAASAVKDATDDVPEENVPKEAQSIVRGYFNTVDGAGK